MTLRYASITPETIGDEHQTALAQLATKYQLPTLATPPASEKTTDPDQPLLDTLRAGCASTFRLALLGLARIGL